MVEEKHQNSYSYMVWRQFRKRKLGMASLIVVILFCLVGIYAPLLASSKPLVVYFDGQWYFPLFRYLFYQGFFTKRLDLFYNLFMFTLPLLVLTCLIGRNYPRQRFIALMFILLAHFCLFIYLAYRTPQDPATSPLLNQERQRKIQEQLKEEQKNPLFYSPVYPNWDKELSYLTPYAKLNLVLRYQQRKIQHQKLLAYEPLYRLDAQKKGREDLIIPSPWHLDERNEQKEIDRQKQVLDKYYQTYPKAKELLNWLKNNCQSHSTKLNSSLSLPPWLMCDFLVKLSTKDRESLIQAKQIVVSYERAQAELNYLKQRRKWLEQEISHLHNEVMPFIRPYHWEDDVGGSQALNRYISWWDLTRINRKDMVASLIFGVRISLSVGLLAVALALLIGIPVGALSGFYGGKIDIITYRLIEIWESMPTFFMLLMVVAFLQSKSIFLVIGVIGLFGWTGFSRFIRGEFFRQKELPYVEACRALGFSNSYIMFFHLLPNAIPPLLTLVPFAIMGAITSEAGLSFLGLGEEGSSSWGVLMDEGRSAFPAESYLLWPPAILLTILLVAIALVGDALRDALDPKLHFYL
jgi:peptide/nickel transport system permease protein